jgi:hypothetical protein
MDEGNAPNFSQPNRPQTDTLKHWLAFQKQWHKSRVCERIADYRKGFES